MGRRKQDRLIKEQEYLESLSEENRQRYERRKKEKALKQARTDIVIKLFGIAVALIVLFTFFIGITTVEGDDMSPALHDGDTAVYLKVGSITNSNVVAYSFVYPSGEKGTKFGRVIASEGSVITNNKGGKLLVDGNIQPKQKDKGLFYETKTGKALKGETITVGAGEYLVLGDKRDTAEDSRSFGLISDNDINGKVIMIIRRTTI